MGFFDLEIPNASEKNEEKDQKRTGKNNPMIYLPFQGANDKHKRYIDCKKALKDKKKDSM